MKFLRLGFIAAMALALCGQQALAADAPAAPKMDAKIHEQSMKDAPPLVQAAGLDCAVTDAYLLGTNDEKVSGKTYKSSFYELACGQGGLGYIFKSSPGQDNSYFDCISLKNAAEKAIAAKQKPGSTCGMLPGNADPKSGLLPLLTKAGITCPSVSNAAWLGASPADKVNIYEAVCSNGVGYLISAPAPGSTKMLNVADCAKSDLIGVACELTTKDQISKHIISLSGPANRPACAPDKARWVVTDAANGNDFYELGCSDGKTAYILQTDSKGGFKAAIDCVKATRIAGGCTYMNVNNGETSEVATYTKLAKQIGSDCAVSKYQSYGTEAGGQREIVELACGNHPDGLYAMVPTATGQTGEYFNCVRALGRGLTCHLSPIEATYAMITKEIASRGKVTCAVSNGRAIGKDDKGQDYVEVACGAAPGLVLTYSRLPQETLVSAVPCAQAPIANACTFKK